METKFNFNSAICTSRSQSERLLALGLKPETADCVWIEMSKDDWRVDANGWKAYYSIIQEGIFPAWSLHRLMLLATSNRKVMLMRYDFDIFDYLIRRIEYAIQEGYFNKEYLV